MRCEKCHCYADNGGQYGGLDNGLCSSCQAREKAHKEIRDRNIKENNNLKPGGK